MMITPGVDIDLPAELVNATAEQPPKPRKNSPEFERLDLRIKPENREKALAHLATIKASLFSEPQEQPQQATTATSDVIARKTALLTQLQNRRRIANAARKAAA